MEKLKYPIYLIGLPGSGKSSIGILLSKKLNLKHIDLDKKIVEKENTNIYDLIKIKGEKYFRFIETEILKKNMR
jgi:shikimate kinase